MLDFGCTRVELGVQILDDEVYKLVNRGHSVQTVIDATLRLKKAGFKVGYHMMPGLPGSNPKKDLVIFKKLFKDSSFKPDQLKIYPCQVIKGSALEKWYERGKYKPYDKKTTEELLMKMLMATPQYCRIMRVMREIPLDYLVAGIDTLDLRKIVEEKVREKKIKIKEIRFREIGFESLLNPEFNKKLKIKSVKYSASKGKEIFIEQVNKDNILFGLLRLRLEKDKSLPAMVRELHVYGPALNLGDSSSDSSQHKGLGKQLMEEAEKISKKSGFKTIRVISGVGVREYYEKLGYYLDSEGYMFKKL
jgi:elongator complex protein 3